MAGRMIEVDPHGKAAKEPGSKLDAGKNQPSYAVEYFPRAIGAISDIGEFGARKYTRGGWKTVPDGKLRYKDAMLRHLLKEYIEGPYDQDSKLLHLAHLAWNAMAILELELSGGTPMQQPYPRTEEGATD